MKYLLLFCLFFSSLLAQSELSSKTIKFSGELKPNIKKRVSIKTIESLGIKSFEILDPYTKIKTKYSGVDLKTFANFFANENTKSISFNALDGYSVNITKKEWEKFHILLATRINGQIVGYDKKGPLRVVYPKYKKANENFAKNLPKWIWMIKSIEFK
ncbi:molybdopterin-dependent oxidoreductase [Arcobacter roscoffensis]|uniref:Oxidoreductase molybdopterin-binding domain-containing protein n=1 Tax=Arcobacter roscoffensis TaxID=2961520 RepID=A0ABY5E5Z3_9BACT|nr:molybdopterin-dependent oxidoreductase [Arcobacter roscoffensis]UTJ07577.1 hypothetical protein NJU99_05625 [Arcobacter roscoffensis]